VLVEHKLSRKVATYVTTGITIILSLVTLLWTFDINILGHNFTSTFDIYDYGSANILLPLGGLFTCIFVGWVMKPYFLKDEISNYSEKPLKVASLILFLVRYITPLLILYIFLKGIGII
jgi:NSS family neurotransmitter:Na+ symporter